MGVRRVRSDVAGQFLQPLLKGATRLANLLRKVVVAVAKVRKHVMTGIEQRLQTCRFVHRADISAAAGVKRLSPSKGYFPT
jgi:hypothetical protein